MDRFRMIFEARRLLLCLVVAITASCALRSQRDQCYASLERADFAHSCVQYPVYAVIAGEAFQNGDPAAGTLAGAANFYLLHCIYEIAKEESCGKKSKIIPTIDFHA